MSAPEGRAPGCALPLSEFSRWCLSAPVHCVHPSGSFWPWPGPLTGSVGPVVRAPWVFAERVTGIEPAPPAWKAGALAVELHPQGFSHVSPFPAPFSTGPEEAWPADLRDVLVGEGGFEPPTSCSQSRCATTALLPVTGCTIGPRRACACRGPSWRPIQWAST